LAVEIDVLLAEEFGQHLNHGSRQRRQDQAGDDCGGRQASDIKDRSNRSHDQSNFDSELRAAKSGKRQWMFFEILVDSPAGTIDFVSRADLEAAKRFVEAFLDIRIQPGVEALLHVLPKRMTARFANGFFAEMIDPARQPAF